jgi:hypothetical protein
MLVFHFSLLLLEIVSDWKNPVVAIIAHESLPPLCTAPHRTGFRCFRVGVHGFLKSAAAASSGAWARDGIQPGNTKSNLFSIPFHVSYCWLWIPAFAGMTKGFGSAFARMTEG